MFQDLWNRFPYLKSWGWVQRPNGAKDVQTFRYTDKQDWRWVGAKSLRQTDMTGSGMVQSPSGAKADGSLKHRQLSMFTVRLNLNDHVENLVELKEKPRIWSVLKGDLPTRSSFSF